MESPIQQVKEAVQAGTDQKEMEELLESLQLEEREMVAGAWIAGNREGWEMTTDWPQDGYMYYDKKYNR